MLRLMPLDACALHYKGIYLRGAFGVQAGIQGSGFLGKAIASSCS